VLLLDLDPQACLLRIFGEEATAALHPIMTGGARLAECVRPTEHAGLHLVAASPDLDTEEHLRSLGPGAEQLLDHCLDELDPQLWDLLLVDCPPGVNRLAVSALVAAHEHLAPIEPTPLCVGTLAATLDLAEAVRSRPNSELAPTRIVLSRVDRKGIAPALTDELNTRHPGAVLDTTIPSFGDGRAPSARLDPIVGHGVWSAAAPNFGALASELLRTRTRRATKPAGLELQAPDTASVTRL
jgi:chromosome partitioning protein